MVRIQILLSHNNSLRQHYSLYMCGAEWKYMYMCEKNLKLFLNISGFHLPSSHNFS